MFDTLYWKHLLIRTPWEDMAKMLRYRSDFWERMRHPELRDIHLEPMRCEEAMRRLITSTSNCIDVGCHIGSTLSLMVRLAPFGHHLAFEPIPKKVTLLRRKFPEVEIEQVALCDSSGTAMFTENLNRPGFSSLAVSAPSSDRTINFPVCCDRLDRYLTDETRVDFLKLDVEGCELSVLRGAVEMIKRDFPVILFESGPGSAEKFGLSRKELFDFLAEEHGYSIFFINDYLNQQPPLAFSAFDRAHEYPFKAFNYLALKEGQPARGRGDANR